MASRNTGIDRLCVRICSVLMGIFGLSGGVTHASEPRLDGPLLQERIEKWWHSDGDRTSGPRWRITEVLGCVPAFDTKREKPWRDHWVCVSRTTDPDFVARVLIEVKGADWEVIDLSGEPACPPLAEAQAALRRVTGLAQLKVTGELNNGQGCFTNRRGSSDKPIYPWRICCRYETDLTGYDVYVWYENGQYVFDPGDMSGLDVPEPRFIRRDHPSAMHIEAVRQAAAAEEARNAAADAAAVDSEKLVGWSSSGERIKPDEANRRFQLAKRLSYFDTKDKARIRVVEGDLRIDGNLLLDWDDFGSSGLVVTGDLCVGGAIINANGDGGPFLVVGGKTRARAIVGGGAQLVFENDAEVADIVIGHYNHGELIFKTNLTVPVVVTTDHMLDIRGKLDGRFFDTFNGDDKWASFLDMRLAELASMDEDEWRGLDKGLIPLLKAGRNVLRPDLPPKDKHPKN